MLGQRAAITFFAAARHDQLDSNGHCGLPCELGETFGEVLLHSGGPSELGGIRRYIDGDQFEGSVQAGGKSGSEFYDLGRQFGTGKGHDYVEGSGVLPWLGSPEPLRCGT